MKENKPRAILIGLDRSFSAIEMAISDSIQELGELANTAQLQVVDIVIQKRDLPDRRHYLGKGKLEELKELIEAKSATIVIADDELTPSQQKELESVLKVKITDRTGLILDIFARRAQTKEAQLQVELAQLEYQLPRLTRLWTHLSRLGGGIGTRGPGEKQLEVDKRQVSKRISTIKDKLKKVKLLRETNRSRREIRPVLTGAIVGYTNAGKSTLMNALTHANVLSEDQLFATLDPTTRKLVLPKGEMVLLTDTVGFIQKLPHQLVTSFQATLEEINHAHFILRVVDLSFNDFEFMIDTTSSLLKELNAEQIPQIFVFNKIDKLKLDQKILEKLNRFKPFVLISAQNNLNLDSLKSEIEKILGLYRKKMDFIIPYSRMDIVSLLHKYGHILEETYEDQIKLKVDINTILGQKIMGELNH